MVVVIVLPLLALGEPLLFNARVWLVLLLWLVVVHVGSGSSHEPEFNFDSSVKVRRRKLWIKTWDFFII